VFPASLTDQAAELLDLMRRRRMLLATAESCTGGLLAALLTEIPGASDVLERGFVTYSNDAKSGLLGVSFELLSKFGAVSEPVARAMAEGALRAAPVDVAIAITGVAGPGGGSELKPVGLVHVAVANAGAPTSHRECRFGDAGRDAVRLKSLEAALALARRALKKRVRPLRRERRSPGEPRRRRRAPAARRLR
jgi:nicotinamide-nucleotide amidase